MIEREVRGGHGEEIEREKEKIESDRGRERGRTQNVSWTRPHNQGHVI